VSGNPSAKIIGVNLRDTYTSLTLLIAMLREQSPPPPSPHHTGHKYREIERNSRLQIVFPVLIPHFPVLKHAPPQSMETRVVAKHMVPK
jgi:hypothetical protein